MAENFPHLSKAINLQIQQVQWTPNRINPKKSMSWYIIIKLLKTKSKEKNLENSLKEKQHIT